MHTLWQDLHYAVRMLAKHPGFTAAAVLTLALGVGANTAIFSLVNAVLLRPLPFAEPERLVVVWEDATALGVPRNEVAPGNFAEWRARQTTFDDLAALDWKSFALTGDGEPLKV